jgi:hypothetical protein
MRIFEDRNISCDIEMIIACISKLVVYFKRGKEGRRQSGKDNERMTRYPNPDSINTLSGTIFIFMVGRRP